MLSTSSWGKTKFVWTQRVPGELSSGYCSEVSTGSNHANYHLEKVTSYAVKVNVENCRPNKVIYLFNSSSGKCYEADQETEGNKYFSNVLLKKCKPETTKYAVLKIHKSPGCYEIDPVSNGKNYHAKVRSDLCVNDNSKFLWDKKSEKSGYCYLVAKDDLMLKVNHEYCVPDRPNYHFERTGPFQGHCLQQSPSQNNNYSRKVKIELCRPKDTAYFFYKESEKDSGTCYELDTETKGDNYLSKVQAKFCK